MFNEFRTAFWGGVDAFYARGVEEDGEPIGLALFDPQVLAPLDWLVQRTGADEKDVLELLEDGVIPRRFTEGQELGFTIFTEAQVRFLNSLRSSDLCSESELRHIVRFENELIEDVILEITPYDDQNLSDLKNLKNRINSGINETAEHEGLLKESAQDDNTQKQLENLASIRSQLGRLNRIFGTKNEGELSSYERELCRKQLFRFRYLDEWIRLQDIFQYEAQIRQGYSPEFIFSSWATNGPDQFVFGAPQWDLTLERVLYSRSLARRYPIRTPDFVFSEDGLVLRLGTTPDRYSEVFQRYKLDEMFCIVKRLEGRLWNPPAPPPGMQKCVLCDTVFKPRRPKHSYCSEQCRQRAKHQRWRQRDPERARTAAGRYYARNYPELFDGK